MFKKIILFLIFFTLLSCSGTRPAIVTKQGMNSRPKKTMVSVPKKSNVIIKKPKKSIGNSNKEVIESTSKTIVTGDLINDYVLYFKDIAIGNMNKYGIPASIILAQGILESGAGKGDLAVNANNHFGIKCHADWTGESVRHDDDSAQECFRKYNDASESFKDHATFLKERSRYAKLFALPKDDYKAWAKGLRAAGYATDPRYPEKLISYIERYSLHKYDSQILEQGDDVNGSKKSTSENYESKSENLYEIQKGDTLYSISKRFNLTVEELKAKNNLIGNGVSIGQRLIIN